MNPLGFLGTLAHLFGGHPILKRPFCFAERPRVGDFRAADVTVFRVQVRVISTFTSAQLLWFFGRMPILDVNSWGICSGSGTAKPRPDLSIPPNLCHVSLHCFLPVTWNSSLCDVTCRVGAIFETISANVEPLAHLAIGWATLFFSPKWHVSTQLSYKVFLPVFTIFHLEIFFLVCVDDAFCSIFISVPFPFPFILFILWIWIFCSQKLKGGR